MEIIDTHSHIYDEKICEDLEGILKRAEELGVKKIVVPGTNISNSKEILEKYSKYNNIYITIGIHPEEVGEYLEKAKAQNLDKKQIKSIIEKDLLELENLLPNKKVVAIGEIGLDYYWDKTEENHEIQKWLLIRQIEIAKKYDLPVVIHTRNATLDTIEVLKENTLEKKGIIHCAPFNEHLIKEMLKVGYYISFSGIVTFKNARPESSILLVPNDKILVETDAPYLTPEPFRGKNNEPKNTYYTLKKIAEIRNIPIEELARLTTENAKRIYGIN